MAAEAAIKAWAERRHLVQAARAAAAATVAVATEIEATEAMHGPARMAPD